MGSTDPGFVNRNGQINLGRTDPPRSGTDHVQSIYVMRCPSCSRNYGANGTDIWLRRCPFHDGGKPGLQLTPEEELLEKPIHVEGSSERPINSIKPLSGQISELGGEPVEAPHIRDVDDFPARSPLSGNIGPISRLIKRASRISILKQVGGKLNRLW